MITATAVIKRDHKAVKADYKKFQRAKGVAERKRIATRIFNALDKHAKMEEKIYYPAVVKEAKAKARKMVEESLIEHAEMKEMVRRFRGKDAGLGFGMKIDELLAGVLHHAGEEEKELLPDVDKSMKRERLQELGERMDKVSPSRRS